jgi:outer membrane protein TolC
MLISGVVCSVEDRPLTISELIDIALTNNPSTKQAWWNANRAAASLGSSYSSYYPQLALQASASHGYDFQFTNGPDTNYTLLSADLVLSALLYDFGARSAGVASAKAGLQAAQWSKDWNIQHVIVTVLENVYATLHAQEVLQAAQTSLEEANKILAAAQEMHRVGLTPISDIYLSEATAAQMRMELSMQKALLDIQRGKLATVLGLPATKQLTLAEINPVETLPVPEIQGLIDLAMQRRADLLARQARLAESLANKEKAFAGYGPKIAFSARGGADHAVKDRASAAHYQFLVSLEMPLFDGLNTMYQNRMAYADTQLSMESVAELELTIAMEVLTHSRTLEALQALLPVAERCLVNAQKSYDSMLEKYRAGKDSITEVSTAQSALAAARVRYSDVKTRLLSALANLAYATGTLME